MILHEKTGWDINMYDLLIMVMIISTSMNLVNVLVRFNQLLCYFCSFPHIQYRHPPSHLPPPKKKKKKISGFENTFLSFHLRCCKNENLWWFSPYPVNTTIIWPTTDRIPHSLIFERVQIKWIVDHIRAFSFVLTIWTKNLTRTEFIVEASFFTSWTIRSEKCARAHVQQNKTIYLSIYLSLWKPFWKRVYIYIYI